MDGALLQDHNARLQHGRAARARVCVCVLGERRLLDTGAAQS
jgi:hypothetical protein